MSSIQDQENMFEVEEQELKDELKSSYLNLVLDHHDRCEPVEA